MSHGPEGDSRGDAIPTGTFDAPPVHASEHPETWAQFRDLRPIGGGGFGAVYRAWDTELHREVALKLLTPRGTAQQDEAAALHEARMMARVRHPNIVPVYGVAAAEGRVGFWSELIEGQSLASLVQSSGPLDPRAAAHAVLELCEAIAAIHAAGVLHRDIKAENALRDTNGRVLLVDFGLTRDPGTHFFGGTIPYMAPELFAGKPATPASDIYALGALLYFLVSGSFPLRRTPQNLRAALDPAELRPLAELRPELPKAFLDIVSRATSFHPEARFATAEGMRLALGAFLGSAAPAKPPKRRPWIAAATGASLFIAAGAWFFATRITPTPAAPTSANSTYQQGHNLLERRDKRGNAAAAAMLLRKAIATDPQFALAHAELGAALWEQYRETKDPPLKSEAESEAGRALAIDPETPKAFLVLGRIHEGTGQRNLAMSDFRRALQLDPRSADAYRELAEILGAEGRDSDADTSYQKAIDLDPNNWQNYNLRGVWLLDKGRIDEAASEFEKELQATPDNLFGLNNLARARTRQNRLTDARQLLEKSIRQAPNDPGSHTSLGFLLMQLGDFDAAVQQFQATTKLDPGNYVSWENLASAIQFGSGGLEEAKPAYRKAVELAEPAHRENPSDALLSASLGGLYAALQRRDESLTLLRQAAALAPEDANVLESVGEGYEMLGMRDQAVPLIMGALSRGYPADLLKRSPDLAALLKDPKFKWPVLQVRKS